MKKLLLLSVFCVALSGLCLSASAAAPQKVGTFGYWEVYKLQTSKQPTCYMSLTAKPPRAKGSKLNRGLVTLMITQRPAEGSLDVISYGAGIKFKPSSEVYLTDHQGHNYNLFTQDDTAWARDAATDRLIAMSLRAADSVTISGTSAYGEAFADTISMKGSAKAYRVMNAACGLPVANVPWSSVNE